MRNIERRMLVVTRAAAALGVLFLLIVAGLTVVDIMVRAASGRPIHGADDLSRMLTIIIVAACFPAGLLERRQIKVTFLGDMVPAVSRVLEVLGALLTGLMFALMAYYVTQYAIRVGASQEYTMVLRWPIAPWWWAASVCFWACVPAQLFVIVAEALGQPPLEE